MEKSKVKIWCIVLVVCILATTGFIFINSLEDFETSHNASGAIVNIIESQGTHINDTGDDFVNMIIRKIAHLLEFGLLGTFVMWLLLVVKSYFKKSFYGFAFFYILLISVVDEFLQSFSDRSSTISDVLLDFSGAVLGFAFVIIIASVISKLRRTKSL